MKPECAYKIGQGNLEQRRDAIQLLNRLVDKVEQERDGLRRFISGNSGIYLIGISKEPWNGVRILIGSEQDYNRMLNNEHNNEIILGAQI